MYRYLYILLFSFIALCSSSAVLAQADDTDYEEDTTEVKKKKIIAGHQLTLGVDIFRPIMTNFVKDRYAYELESSYYLKNDYYLVAQAGWGGCNVNDTDIQYKTTNTFVRAGFHKGFLSRDKAEDWDMAFIGLGGGFANVQRGDASYLISDTLWGRATETQPGKAFQAFWFGITGGVRVELFKGLFAGWNVRGQFMMNPRSFRDLAPVYIAGFGKGDKNSSFDMNFYISYAIRWARRNTPELPPAKTDVPSPEKKP